MYTKCFVYKKKPTRINVNQLVIIYVLVEHIFLLFSTFMYDDDDGYSNIETFSTLYDNDNNFSTTYLMLVLCVYTYSVSYRNNIDFAKCAWWIVKCSVKTFLYIVVEFYYVYSAAAMSTLYSQSSVLARSRVSCSSAEVNIYFTHPDDTHTHTHTMRVQASIYINQYFP